MNKILDFNITGQHIEWGTAYTLVAGTVNEYTARFAFKGDWDGYQRIAVFSADGVEREQLLTDDTCTVPWEVLLPGAYLKVGVYGVMGGSRLPTIWTTHRQYIHDGAGPTDEAADPSPVLAEQILQRMGDLDALKTEDKSSLVAAINEVKETGGGGGTSDHSKLKNRDAADQHPMSAITGLEDALEGKLPASELPAAINTALAQAKASGEFDGKDGSPGADGKDGVGIQSVTQTTTSTEDGGANIVTVTKTDGTTSTFEVRNGSRGSIGPAGADGKDGSQGPAGADGKTAYQYAQEGGYTGTEAEFAKKMAAEIPEAYTLPIASSTVLGGVKPADKTAEMTQSVGVDAAGGLWTAPGSGGGAGWELLATYTLTPSDKNLKVEMASFGCTKFFLTYDLPIKTANTTNFYIMNANAIGQSILSTSVNPFFGYSVFEIVDGCIYGSSTCWNGYQEARLFGINGKVRNTLDDKTSLIFQLYPFVDGSEELTIKIWGMD